MSGLTHTRSVFLLLLCALWLFVPARATGQARAKDPHLAYAFPAGCRQGVTQDIVIGGQHLKDVSEAFITGDGVSFEIGKWYRPLTRGEFNDLRMAFDEARKNLMDEGKSKPTEEEIARAAKITEDQLREMERFRQRDRDEKRQPNEQLEEELTITMTVAADAPPGKRELRLLTSVAMSNPLWIQIGKYPEVLETEPNDHSPDASAIQQFPIVINGQIMPGETDKFSFEARQGMRLVIMAQARDVIPYLADAVPGWFQAELQVFDSQGRAMTCHKAFQFSQDPVIYLEVPRNNRYFVQIHDTLYRGREDFVYRLTLGEIPLVTSIFPLGVHCDEKTTVQLQGWNLSQTTLEVGRTAFHPSRPLRWHTVEQNGGHSVQIPLYVDKHPEVFDREPNNDQDTAQRIPTRAIINGRIDAPGDEDVFHVTGSGRLALEVRARRLGSPLDSLVSVTNAQGKEIAFNDDFEDKSEGLLTHHADSRLVATIPPGGVYIRVSDAQGNGGAEFVYRLYLRTPQPDFELRVAPANLVGRAGATIPISVHVLREDNFTDDIHLSLVDAPAGFHLSGNVIPGNVNQMQLTLTLPPNAPPEPVILNMVGAASRDGKHLRPAVPAEDMTQAFIWHHLIPVENWIVIVNGKPGPKPPYNILLNGPRVALARGGKSYLPLQMLTNNVSAEDLHVSVREPQGVAAAVVSNGMGGFAIELTTDADKLSPGLRGNLLMFAYRTNTPTPTKENPQPKASRTDLGYFPALAFEVMKQHNR